MNKKDGQHPVTASKAPSPASSPSKPSSPPKPSRKPMPPWVRIPLIMLRSLLVPVLCVAALVGGVVFGYVYMGGKSSDDVWNFETWKHLFELVFAN